MVIPGCKLYVREVLSAIAQLTCSSKLATKVQGGLHSDIQYWSHCLPWRLEQHCIVTLFCNASKCSWGGVYLKDGKRMESKDYWLDSWTTSTLLKLWLCLHSLLAFRDHIRDSRVNIHTVSRTLKAALEDLSCKSSSVNKSVKEILQCSCQLNFAINVRSSPLAATQRTCH